MIFVFNNVIKDGTATPLILQQNSKEINAVYIKQVQKKKATIYHDHILSSYACELYMEVLIIETLNKKIEIEFTDNISVNEALKHLAQKMINISDYDSDRGAFYTKLKDDI
jgi:hypothetical protein